MLRSFHYIDEKGKDQGINGTVPRTLRLPLRLYFFFVSQCGIVQKRSSSFSPMSIRFARNAKKPSPTEPNMSALVTTASPLAVDAMEGLGVNRLVVVTVVTMDPTQAGTIEVGSRPLPDKVLADFRIQITRVVGAAVDSGITRQGEPVLTNTMLAKMRLRAAAQPPP